MTNASTTTESTVPASSWKLSLLSLTVALILVLPVSAFAQLGPATVDLGTAENYVILAMSGISSIPTTAITGDIAVSPIAATSITGLDLDFHTGYATSPQVTGKVYAADMEDPTPSNLTTAVSNMETAFTDAAGRPDPDFIELYDGNVGSRTLLPGLYKWSGSVTAPNDFVIAGGPDDVWIFQIAGDLLLSSSASVTLAGGARAQNIFWQVSGGVSAGTNSHLEGIVLSKTAITLQTGASLNGRALSQTAVTFDQNTVVEPASDTPPLPVELVSFDAALQGRDALLTWRTASEVNAAGFHVQRHMDGAFADIGFVEALGNSREGAVYNFRAADLGVGAQSFRLRQVDLDGSVAFSSVVEVNVGLAAAFELSSAYPTPFNPQTRFELTVAREQNVTVTVYDMLGRRVAMLHDGLMPANDTHTFTFSGAALSSGTYLYRVEGETFVETRRMTLIK